jgi:hypothetical protein
MNVKSYLSKIIIVDKVPSIFYNSLMYRVTTILSRNIWNEIKILEQYVLRERKKFTFKVHVCFLLFTSFTK